MFLRLILLAATLTAEAQQPPVRQYKWIPQNSPAAVLRRVDPEPAAVEGTVVLEVEVATDGKPGRIRVARSLGREPDEKALDAVKQWLFKPAYKNSEPVPSTLTIEIKLQK